MWLARLETGSLEPSEAPVTEKAKGESGLSVPNWHLLFSAFLPP